MIDGQAGLKEHSEFQMLPVDDLPRRFVAQVPVTKTGEIGNRRRPDLGDHGDPAGRRKLEFCLYEKCVSLEYH